METQVHDWTGPTGVQFRDIAEPSGTYYRDGTPRRVIEALEAARINGSRVRVFYGDKSTGKDWLDENDVTGYIGRTTGPVKVPILLCTRRSSGGPAMLCDCIVRMIGGFTIVKSTTDKYEADVFVGDTIQARFTTWNRARRWVDFMQGNRLTK